MGCLKLHIIEEEFLHECGSSIPLKHNIVIKENGLKHCISYDKGCGEYYRFGFNGQEKDNEVSGIGNSYTAEYWQYDPRSGRRWNVDPMAHLRSWISPYNAMQNNPIIRIDPTGALDGWVEDDEGNVSWDQNTNSQEEFETNYAGKDGYSYVSDVENPNSYTLPNGDGKVIVNQWKEYEIGEGTGGPFIELEFVPSDENANTGWFQTFSSNMPDVSEETLSSTMPGENIEERLDGGQIMDKSDITQAVYFGPFQSPSNILNDIPTRKLNEGAINSIIWNAQSSIIIDGKRSFSIGWGFTIDSQNSGSYSPPTILNSVSEFHQNAIKYLK
jgi:RHS repeat-associated protein